MSLSSVLAGRASLVLVLLLGTSTSSTTRALRIGSSSSASSSFNPAATPLLRTSSGSGRAAPALPTSSSSASTTSSTAKMKALSKDKPASMLPLDERTAGPAAKLLARAGPANARLLGMLDQEALRACRAVSERVNERANREQRARAPLLGKATVPPPLWEMLDHKALLACRAVGNDSSGRPADAELLRRSGTTTRARASANREAHEARAAAKSRAHELRDIPHQREDALEACGPLAGVSVVGGVVCGIHMVCGGAWATVAAGEALSVGGCAGAGLQYRRQCERLRERERVLEVSAANMFGSGRTQTPAMQFLHLVVQEDLQCAESIVNSAETTLSPSLVCIRNALSWAENWCIICWLCNTDFNICLPQSPHFYTVASLFQTQTYLQ